MGRPLERAALRCRKEHDSSPMACFRHLHIRDCCWDRSRSWRPIRNRRRYHPSVGNACRHAYGMVFRQTGRLEGVVRKGHRGGLPPQTINALDTVAITIMYCRQCGASNPEDAKFCRVCRRRVEGYRDPVFYAESAFWNYYGNFILIFGLVFAAIFLLFILLHA